MMSEAQEQKVVMNVYECEAENESIAEYIGGYARYEPDNILVFIIARSRGQARGIFCKEYDFEFTSKISIKKVASEVGGEAGITDFDTWYELSDFEDLYGFSINDYMELGQD